jgi:hypothetical protein
MESLVSLCKASKQLQDQCLDYSDQQLQLIVHKALLQNQPKELSSARDLAADPSNCHSSLAWLIGALSKRWGIVQLAARLDLQQALLAAEQDSLACHMLIRAGARITPELLRASDSIIGLIAWAETYEQLCLSYCPIPHELMQAIQGDPFEYEQLVGLDDELLYDLLRVALLDANRFLIDMLVDATRVCQWLGWSVEMDFQLTVLALKRSNGHVLQHMFSLPVAEHITGQQYSNLLVLLLSHGDGYWHLRTTRHIIQHVHWDDQLVEQISAAVESQVASSFTPCRYECGICQVLQQICSDSAATLPVQLQTSLLCAATGSHRDAACTILRHLARSEVMTEGADGRTAVAAALQSWPVEPILKYRRYFKRLLLQPAVQQLPLGEVEQLLQQAAGSGCAEGLRCLLKALPAAEEVTVEGYYQLLELVVGNGTYRGRGRSCSKEEVLAVLLRCNLSSREPPGAAQLQQLVLKCIENDEAKLVKCLLGGFKEAAQQLSPAAVYGLLLQAATSVVDCFSALLDLVPQLEELPLEVLQELLPALMKHSCPRVKLTAATVRDHASYIDLDGARSCSVCSLLKAAAGKLAAADVWEVLVAAAKAQGESFHLGGLMHLPWVDDLADDQVEQLLLAAIEVRKGPSFRRGHGQQLVWRLEQLQGELLLGRRLPSAAVHRLMLACVETAGSGRVGELREELGLPTKGWEGPLSQQQLEQLLQIAIADGLESGQGMVRGEASECVLVVARLLPSSTERQQVEDVLWAAGVQVSLRKQRDCRSPHDRVTFTSSESLSEPESASHSGAESELLEEELVSGSDADMDADSESDLGADSEPDPDTDSGPEFGAG